MGNFLIMNNVNSNTITGLLIQNLPPITKPRQRVNIEEIDGRDGDIITSLGYGAYDKEFQIGLSYNYDINEIIKYFDSEGTVTFSNEPDKYYNYKIIEQIDYEKLIRFKTANVKMHVQPFKYATNEEPIEQEYNSYNTEGKSISLENTVPNIFNEFSIQGNSEQNGTPSPTNPVQINSAGNPINSFDKNTILAGHLINANGTITEDNYNFVSDFIEVNSNREYTISAATNKSKRIAYYNASQTFISRPVVSDYTGTVTTPSNAKYVRLSCNNDDLNSLQFYSTQGEITVTISNGDNTETQEINILCQQPMRSIGNVRDEFVKENGIWYEKHNIGVIESYNGESITTEFMSTTGELTTGAFIQYLLDTPNYIECTQEQSDALESRKYSYDGQTNIGNQDETPAYIKVALNDNSVITISNEGNIYSKPIVTIHGSGDIGVILNNTQIFEIALGEEEYIVIDVTLMEAYKGNTLKNRLVKGNYDNFKLEVGNNTLAFTGAITECDISKYSRWI